MKRFLMALGLFIFSVTAMAELGPDELVRRTVDDVLASVKSDKEIQEGNQARIFALAEEKIVPNFNFEKMSRLVLGRNWTNASAEQKVAFQAEFKTLLLRTYATALSKYKNQTIDFRPFRMESNESIATVRTMIRQPGGQPIAVDYTLGKNGDTGWKVYDIVIEGVSLVTNFRSQFAQEVRQNGLDTLVEKLADKNKVAMAR